MEPDMSFVGRKAEILVDRPFSLVKLGKHARALEALVQERREELGPWTDGSVLPFIMDGYDRARETQRRQDGVKELGRAKLMYEVRARIVEALIDMHGPKASVRQLDLPSWPRTMLGGAIPPMSERSENALYEDMEWVVKNGVAVPYVARITKPGKQSRALRSLWEATELRTAEEPVDLLEKHYAWSILNIVLEQDPTEAAPGLQIYREQQGD